VDIDSNVEAC
jgi:hypothetical protein